MYVIGGLIAIGLLMSFVENPGSMIIPVVIFGLVFLLYKFPPAAIARRFRGFAPPPGRSGKQAKRRPNFRVIQGRKPQDDDDRPRYH